MRRITLTADQILVSFTVKLLKGPGKVFSYFGEGTSFLLFIILVDDELFYLKKFSEWFNAIIIRNSKKYYILKSEAFLILESIRPVYSC